MKRYVVLLIMVVGGVVAFSGCSSTGDSVHTAADTQPRPYMQDVTSPQNQPQFDRMGAMHY